MRILMVSLFALTLMSNGCTNSKEDIVSDTGVHKITADI